MLSAHKEPNANHVRLHPIGRVHLIAKVLSHLRLWFIVRLGLPRGSEETSRSSCITGVAPGGRSGMTLSLAIVVIFKTNSTKRQETF